MNRKKLMLCPNERIKKPKESFYFTYTSEILKFIKRIFNWMHKSSRNSETFSSLSIHSIHLLTVINRCACFADLQKKLLSHIT